MKNCVAIIFDSMSSMLAYHDTFSVLRLANAMKSESYTSEKIKVFLMVSEDISSMGRETFAMDFEMFADSIQPF